ncbi:MAG TPA: hypothetical protein DCX54_04165 [Flavobacteriales bacterium]|nr:hypothetical protein [Flavobacteriales bacterium]
MFFWWAPIVLFFSIIWDETTIHLVSLFPALAPSIFIAWALDRFKIIKSWLMGATIGWFLNVATQMIWVFLTTSKGAASDGPLMFGAVAVWVNLVAIIVIHKRQTK